MVADLIYARFDETVSATNPGPRTYAVMTDWGTWGQGATLSRSSVRDLISCGRRDSGPCGLVVLRNRLARPVCVADHRRLALS